MDSDVNRQPVRIGSPRLAMLDQRRVEVKHTKGSKVVEVVVVVITWCFLCAVNHFGYIRAKGQKNVEFKKDSREHTHVFSRNRQ